MTTTLSRHTANDVNSLMKQPFHFVLGLYNTLIKQTEEENKKQKEAQASAKSQQPKLPYMPSSVNVGGKKISVR